MTACPLQRFICRINYISDKSFSYTIENHLVVLGSIKSPLRLLVVQLSTHGLRRYLFGKYSSYACLHSRNPFHRRPPHVAIIIENHRWRKINIITMMDMWTSLFPYKLTSKTSSLYRYDHDEDESIQIRRCHLCAHWISHHLSFLTGYFRSIYARFLPRFIHFERFCCESVGTCSSVYL